jgi:Domain of unknown function (DUF6487)
MSPDIGHHGGVTAPVQACPSCESPEMVQGVVVGRAPGVKFKRSRGLADLKGVRLTTGVFDHSADALRCQDCGTVVIPPPPRQQ